MHKLQAVTLFLAFLLMVSCGTKENALGPLNTGADARTQIVVISDLHLGADLAYAECHDNLPALAEFLQTVRQSPTVRELVIAGDLLDEWFVPATTDTYAGKDQADFVKRIAAANPEVIGAFNNIIQDGTIRVTYVPGNHDLTITAANVDSILSGINQARDDQLGLGTYSPQDHPEIAIEHGHRYNFFCAPDPLSNAAVAPGSIMPPGYFFTRIAVLHVLQGCETAGDTIPEVTLNPAQQLAYVYWGIWKTLLEKYPVENTFAEKIIVTNLDGFTKTYAINDVPPFQEAPGGPIDMNLFRTSLDTWDQRQTINRVAAHIPIMQALTDAAKASGTDKQAETQYFQNPASPVRIVVFGHTHEPRIIAGENHAGLKTIYANSGTWIDHNPNSSNLNFVVINPQGSAADSQTDVRLYRMNKGRMEELAADSLRLGDTAGGALTDYSLAAHWLHLPQATNKAVDVFYLYPTAWRKLDDSEPNICPIDNASMLAGSASAYARQATAFETVGNVYAPYYRQGEGVYSLSLPPDQRDAFIASVPAADAEAALDYYFQHYNDGRPFLLLGHSQGANVLKLLLAGYFKTHPEYLKRMVAAYIIGYSITSDFLAANPHLHFAQGPDDTGVIISYNTLAPGVDLSQAPFLLPGAIAINPISWTLDETTATTEEGLGSYMPGKGGVFSQVPQYADARVDKSKGVVVCSTAVDSNLILGFGPGVYHSYDIPFYYFNLRTNAANRVEKYLSAQ